MKLSDDLDFFSRAAFAARENDTINSAAQAGKVGAYVAVPGHP